MGMYVAAVTLVLLGLAGCAGKSAASQEPEFPAGTGYTHVQRQLLQSGWAPVAVPEQTGGINPELVCGQG
jgi:hypothetical protein